MSETNIDNVVELPAESETENVENTQSSVAVIVGGTILGVVAVYAAGFVYKTLKDRKSKKEPIHVVTDLEDQNTNS